jgi:hypothetical protein
MYVCMLAGVLEVTNRKPLVPLFAGVRNELSNGDRTLYGRIGACQSTYDTVMEPE